MADTVVLGSRTWPASAVLNGMERHFKATGPNIRKSLAVCHDLSAMTLVSGLPVILLYVETTHCIRKPFATTRELYDIKGLFPDRRRSGTRNWWGRSQGRSSAARVARAFRHILCGFPLAGFTRSLEHERERLTLGRAADLCLLGIHDSVERALHRSRFEPNFVAVANNAIQRNPGAP
ncbi:MAG TPA: hypothetical protein VH601_04210 [Bryobacteraceae bacterium]